MAGEDQALVLVGYRVDTGSVQAAIQANTKVEKSIAAIRAEADKAYEAMVKRGSPLIPNATSPAAIEINRQAAAAAAQSRISIDTGIVAPLDRASTAARNLIRDIGDLGNDIRLIPEPSLGDFGISEGAARGGIGSRISRAGRNLYNLPDFALGGGISSTVVSRGLLLGGAGVEAIGLTTAQLAALGVVGGVAALAIKTVVDAENARALAAEKAADALNNTAGLVGQGATSADLRDQNASLSRQSEILREGRTLYESYQASFAQVNKAYGEGQFDADTYRSYLTALNESLYDATGGFLGLKDGLGQSVSQAGDFTRVLNNNQEDIDAVNQQLASNTLALGSQGVKLNDATAALEAYNEALTQYQVDEADIRIRLRTSTQEGRDERIAAINDEIAILTAQADAVGKGSDAGKEFEARLIQLRQELDLTTAATNTYGDIMAQQRALEETRTQRNENYLDLMREETKLRDDLLTSQEREQAALDKRDAAIEAARADSSDRLVQREEEIGERRISIAENSADRIAKIELEASRATENARGERDVNAFRQARQRQQDALAEEVATKDKQFTELEKQTARMVKTETAALEKRIDAIRAQANEAVRIEDAKQEKLTFTITQNAASQQFLQSYALGNMVNESATQWGNIQNYAITALRNITTAAYAAASQNVSFPTLTSFSRTTTQTNFKKDFLDTTKQLSKRIA